MIISEHFPTLIGYVNNTAFTDRALPVAKEMLNQHSESNTLGYDSTYTSQEAKYMIDKDHFIVKNIKKISKQFLENIGLNYIDNDIRVEVFFSQMKEGDRHDTHLHPHSILSGVCYLECEPNSAIISFDDPRTARFFNGLKPIGDSTQKNSIEVNHIPQTGDILIWESWLRHRTSINQSGNRTTLVFNIVREALYNATQTNS